MPLILPIIAIRKNIIINRLIQVIFRIISGLKLNKP